MTIDVDSELKKHIGIITKYAKKMYLHSNVSDLDDLIQAGRIGLINGCNAFSPERAKQTGTKLSTYVIQCALNAILQEANKFYAHTSLPHNKRLRLNTYRKHLNNGLSKEEIQKDMQMSDTEFKQLETLNMMRKPKLLSVNLRDPLQVR